MEKQLTALAQSIARKKERVKELEAELTELRLCNFKNNVLAWASKIFELNKQITEDEKLLAVEEDQIVSAFNEGVKICAVSNITKKEGEKPYLPLYGEIHYNQTFKTD